MPGELIAAVRYIEGYSTLGEQTLQVRLVAFSTNLTIFERDDNQPLFSIPWANLSNAQTGMTTKRGLSGGGALVLSTLPVFNLLGGADPYHSGIWISFWDEEIQRSQRVFLLRSWKGTHVNWCKQFSGIEITFIER